MRNRLFAALFGVGVMLMAADARAQRWMEKLDRGLVGINQGSEGVFLSWRLLGTEAQTVGFNVYRQTGTAAPLKLNSSPLLKGTWYVDEHPNLELATNYFVRSVSNGVIGPPSHRFRFEPSPPERDYLSIRTDVPAGYTLNDASVGDLDGDGQYEIIVHLAGTTYDNSIPGLSDVPLLRAYSLNGKVLWTINLGKNIRDGAHYTQFMVYDLNADGRAELICKTADGTIDGVGGIIGDESADYRDLNSAAPTFGKVLAGPEYLTVFDGRTGRGICTVCYSPPRHPHTLSPTPAELKSVWGEDKGQRCDRFLACVAYLDGICPSVVMCRGYYSRSVLAAWDWRGGRLRQRWVFDSATLPSEERRKWEGQGNHGICVADVDADGRDEIIYGAMVIDDNGRGLYSTRLGHGDAQHTGDLDPGRPGLEIWSIHEDETPASDFVGSELRDARSGKILFHGSVGADVGRGMSADVDPRYPGCELWNARLPQLLSVKGDKIGPRPATVNMCLWWDGDLLRETLDGVNIYKWNYEAGVEDMIFDGAAKGLSSNNGTKANPCLSADILGDWREELLARTSDNSELRIYISAIPTQHRISTLMHDPQYRLSIAWQNVAYNQPPHPSYFLGAGMALPPRPNIRIIGE